ncbi:MAG: hypothetical protein IH586_04060 [Anaerolineaceae bacterium]|nr:hypothetical protein [Anaerolineaceae bacterium]
MKRYFSILLLFGMIWMSGCAQKSEPTLAAGDAANQPPVEEKKPVENTPTPKASTSDPFDSSDDWLAANTITTQALAGAAKTVVEVKDGTLNFDIPDKETYIYTFYKKIQKSDVSIEVAFDSTGLTNNGIALVCRAAEDYSTWYEARVSSSGMYYIYKYDAALKDLGQNRYVKIIAGTTPKNTILPTKPNSVKFTCKGDQLILEINGGKFVTTQQNVDLTGDGLVGIGSMAYDQTPVRIKYDDFKISKP